MSLPKCFFNTLQPKHITENRLPHWDQNGCLVFVTWNLHDAVPGKAQRSIEEQRKRWLVHHPKPWSAKQQREYLEAFIAKREQWLDQGHGASILSDQQLAEQVRTTLFRDNGTAYELDAFVIMPSHVQVLVELTGSSPLARIIQAWKGCSSKRINRLRKTRGTVWQKDYWDRLVRSAPHYHSIRRYIEQNPTKARLAPDKFQRWMRPPRSWSS